MSIHRTSTVLLAATVDFVTLILGVQINPVSSRITAKLIVELKLSWSDSLNITTRLLLSSSLDSDFTISAYCMSTSY